MHDARLDATLRRFVWRMRLVRFVRSLSVFLLGALALAAGVVATDRLVYLGLDAAEVAGGLALAAIAAAAAAAFGSGAGRLRAAMEADRALNLGDRLPSAVQLERCPGPWARRVVEDAAARVRGVRAAAVFPLRLTVSARLLLPALIVFVLVSMLPQADVLGRMEREVDRLLVERAKAGRANRAAGAALPALGGAARQRSGLGGLRLAFVRIERDLLAGRLDAAARLDLGRRLRGAARRAAREPGGRELARLIERTRRALSDGDDAARRALRAAQRQLARLERALSNVETMPPRLRRLAVLRGDGPPRSGAAETGGDGGAAGAPDEVEDLVELAARAREAVGGGEPSRGVLSPRHSGPETGRRAAADYEEAVRLAEGEIENEAYPSSLRRLVRGYFEAIRPARR